MPTRQSGSAGGQPRTGLCLVLELLYVTVILVIPMLLLAGADVADFGVAIAGGVSVSLTTPRIAVPLVASAAAAELAVAFHSLGMRVFVNVALAAALFGYSPHHRGDAALA